MKKIALMVLFFLSQYAAAGFREIVIPLIEGSWYYFYPLGFQVAALLSLPLYYLLGQWMDYKGPQEEIPFKFFGILIACCQAMGYIFWFCYATRP
jgi:MFS-type transporter involved in bile tolerance (Atg22 family)